MLLLALVVYKSQCCLEFCLFWECEWLVAVWVATAFGEFLEVGPGGDFLETVELCLQEVLLFCCNLLIALDDSLSAFDYLCK